jgi:hypothetical protein
MRWATRHCRSTWWRLGSTRWAKIPGSTHKLNSTNLSSCHNPTVSPDGTNLLAKNAAQPDPCDRKGAGATCAAGPGGTAQTSASGGGAASAGGSSGAGTGGTSSAAGGGASTNGTVSGSGAATGTIDPDTGQAVGGAALAGGAGSSGVSAVPVSVDVADHRRQMVLASLAAVLLLGLIIGPPLVARTMRNHAGPQEGPLP